MALSINETDEHNSNWKQLVAPAPMGIAVLSQLLVSACRGSDFKIDKINTEAIPLMKHPESFHKTLVQIANDAYNAFMKAHKNMEKIQLQMGQVPDYATGCIKIIDSRNKIALSKVLSILLENIKKAANDGLKMSTEISEAFDQLGELNRQVLLAIAARHGAKEQEMEKVNKIVCSIVERGIEAGKTHRLEAREREQKELEKQMLDAREKAQRSQQQVDEAGQFRFGDIFGYFVLSNPVEMRVNNAKNDLNEANKRLQQTREETERETKRIEEEKEKICQDFSKSLEKMHVNIDKELSQNEMIKLLEKGMSQLSKLNSNWAGFTLNFNSINNYIEQVTQRALKDFVEDAINAQEDPSLVHFITNSINKSLESSIKTHHNAKMYVEFSNNNIMKSLKDMHQNKNDALLTICCTKFGLP